MAKIRRIIRKLETPHDAALDEQAWPVNVGLVLLGAFSLGATLAYLRFDDPNPWTNAFTWLVLIPLIVGGAMVAFRFIDSKLLRRSMQLALVASAMFHLIVVIMSAQAVIFTALRIEQKKTQAPSADVRPETPIQLSEDVLQPEDDHPRDFERPVETETPEVTPEPVEKEVVKEDSPRRPQPVPVPEPQRTQQPAVVKRPTTEEAAPRESATASRLSRNTKVEEVGPAGAKVEAVRPTTQPSEVKIDAAVAGVSRRPTESKPAERKTEAEPTSTRRSDAQIAKKTTETAPKPDETATATLHRAVNQPKLTPKSQVQIADTASTTRRTSETEPIPNNTAAIRKATAGPTADKASLESTTLPTTPSATPVAKPELESEVNPALSAAPASVAREQPRVTPRPTGPIETPTAATRSAEPTTPGPQATAVARAASASVSDKPASGEPAAAPNAPDTAVSAARLTRRQPAAVPAATAIAAASTSRADSPKTPNMVTKAAEVEATTGRNVSPTISPSDSAALASRQNAPANPSATRTQPALEAPSQGVGSPIASGGMTKATASAVPSINPAATAANTPQRAAREAAVAGSPSSIEAPAAAVGATAAADPTAEPARMALSRSQSGAAGAGNSPNLDRGSAAADSPALVASAAARRAEATSAGPPDAALTPSTAATRAHGRAAAPTPSSAIPAESIANASEGGTTQADEIASSSASITRATGSAAAGEVSAAKGTAEIDVGATTIVSEAGRSRAAGGGQPELNFDPQMAVARQPSLGAPQTSIAADRIAPLPEAPMATGGGQPAALDPAATLAVRGDAAAGTAGGPSKADDKGPLAEHSAAALASDTPASRADDAASGTPDLEDEEEKAKRLARAAAASPTIGTGAAQVSDAPAPAGDVGSLAQGETAPANTATARTAAMGGAPATGGLPAAGENAPASGLKVGPTVARAEMSAAAESPTTVTGGGTATPAKAAGGQPLATNAQVETLQLAGAPTSGGGQEGVPLQAQGIEAAKTSAGAMSPIAEGAIGAAAGQEVVDAFGPQGAGNVAGGSRTISPGTEAGPSISDVATGGGPNKRAAEASVETGEPGQIEIPSIGPTSAVAQADLDHGMATGVGRTASDAGEGVVVNLEAPDGIGGLGQVAAADVGINSRLARPDSLEIGPQPTRFLGRRSGGIPGISTASIVPTDSFKKRAEGRAGRGSLPPQTEAAVELGLAYLARQQQEDGSWRLQGLEGTSRGDPQMVSDTAATALAVLAFQGAGYNHREHKYADVVRGGIDYLVQNQKEDGDLFVPLDDESNRSVWLYSHALASLALCEAYGMTQDPALKEAAQKSIDFIVAGQNKERGGWRYAPGVGSDTSVSGAMLVALRSAELANLNVPKETYDGVTKWLDHSQASPTQAHLYRYNPNAPDTPTQKHGRVASPTMTSLGLLMRLYLGWKRDNPNMIKGADYLKDRLPALGTNNDPQRDTYYWYYATQVMFHMGGDHWKQWHDKLHALLLNTQVKEGPFAGSWNPRLPVADRWGPHGGRLYVTALNLLSLEVQYRHLPTFEDTAK